MSDITFDFACKDDCLDRMVPSDLRKLVAERDSLRQQLEQAQAVPEGWKLVPVEPDAHMEETGCQGYMEADGNFIMHKSSMGYAYRAMLNAAPQPPQEGSGDE